MARRPKRLGAVPSAQMFNYLLDKHELASTVESTVSVDNGTPTFAGNMSFANDPSQITPHDPVPWTYKLTLGDKFIYRVDISGSAGDTVNFSFTNATSTPKGITLPGSNGGAVSVEARFNVTPVAPGAGQ